MIPRCALQKTFQVIFLKNKFHFKPLKNSQQSLSVCFSCGANVKKVLQAAPSKAVGLIGGSVDEVIEAMTWRR